ncbi:MAG: 30S ribosomal protein S4 [Chloroflexi bacterium]|nr:30S ribosomal protein S4 [Chloroflexota bacterium]
MARYAGPICRLCRHAGEKIALKGDRCFTPKCAMERRSKGPGPAAARRRRRSDYAVHLLAKQTARSSYGIMERQFKRIFDEAQRLPGITGETLLVLLERRLDNVLYRIGFADTRAQGRQLVRHGHILVNGTKTTIPSYLVKESDTISWREGSKNTEYYKQLLQRIESKTVPNWLSLDKNSLTGQIVSLPTTGDIDAKFDGQNIVEFYSR